MTTATTPLSGLTVRQAAEAIRRRQLHYEERRDPLAVFAFVYHNVTLDLADRLEARDSGFRDPEWVARLVVAFAERYLVAMDALDPLVARRPGGGERLAPVPAPEPTRPWRDVYDATRDGKSYVLEDLLYGMSAHITYDLPLTLVEAGTDNDRLPDFHRINEVLAARTEEIQHAVAERYHRALWGVDWFIGKFDEFFSNYGIRVARSVAWYNALRLQSPARAAALASIERSTGAFILSVRQPKEWPIRLGIAIMRFLVPRRRRWPDKDPSAGRGTWMRKTGGGTA